MPDFRAGAWMLVLAAAAAGAGCRARDAAVEARSAVVAEPLPLGAPCAVGADCTSTFCVDGVCCNEACGGGVRDALSCSNVYGQVSGLTDGTCKALVPGDRCGALTSIHPCTWRGSTINGGGNCPNPPGTTGVACFPCTDSRQCSGAYPVCLDGVCVGCSQDSDCTPPQKCNTTLRNCGAGCTTDADCASTEWCDAGVCTPKAPNGASCPPANDQACVSGDCFDADATCGLPAGEPCTDPSACRSLVCGPAGVCGACRFDADCGAPDSGVVCDGVELVCKPGCRGTDGSGCAPGATCTSRDDSMGACVTVEGGGPSCSAAPPGAAGSPWIGAALLALTLRTVRRWRR